MIPTLASAARHARRMVMDEDSVTRCKTFCAWAELDDLADRLMAQREGGLAGHVPSHRLAWTQSTCTNPQEEFSWSWRWERDVLETEVVNPMEDHRARCGGRNNFRVG